MAERRHRAGLSRLPSAFAPHSRVLIGHDASVVVALRKERRGQFDGHRLFGDRSGRDQGVNKRCDGLSVEPCAGVGGADAVGGEGLGAELAGLDLFGGIVGEV